MAAEGSHHSDARLVEAAVGGDPTAFGTLFERWFDRVHDVARNIVRNDDTAAEVAQDVFLTAWQRLDQLDDPERFGGWLLRTSRNRALNRLEKERRAQPLEGDVMTGLHDTHHGGADRDDLVGSNRVLATEAISDARDQRQLVWAAAAALGERDVSILDLQLRHQLDPAEIADELGVTANNAHQLLFRLRGKLGDAVANHQVWRDGSPRCAELAALVDGDPFDASTNKIVQRHAKRCEACGAERERVVDPTKLFAAVPIVAAPAVLRDRVAAALVEQGVPLSTDGGGPGQAAETDGSSEAAQRSSGPSADGPGPSAESASGHHTNPDRRNRRRLALVGAVLIVVLLASVLALADPAGNPDVIAGPDSTDDPAADTATTDPDLATPSTTITSTTAPPTTITSSTAPPTTSSTTRPTTAPPTTAPPTTPSTAPPSTEPPTTEPPTPEPPTTEPPPPPEIIRFTLSTPPGAIFCQDSTHVARRASWLTEETTGVELTTANGTTAGDPTDNHTFCAPSGSTVTLTATGPGGTVSQNRTVS